MDIAIDTVPIDGKPVIDNLLQLYIHDFSEFGGFDVDERGRYAYSRLDLYWTEANRFPFLVRVDGKLAGFALVYVEKEGEQPVARIAEFFVMRRYRHGGVGRQAARLLWTALPGTWTVRVSEGNTPALAFWTRVVAEFSEGRASLSTRPGEPHAWRVFYFETAAAVSA